ncbi:hypothetical protein ACFYZ5_43555 [Streptomyces chartreusis]|uniref:hypothetical protein n=1 Tax=Streptomyces chartreusis TaxID=1969 RepID=UPI0036CC763F
MYERHGENAQFGSVRHRDLADVLIGQQDSVRGQAVTQALHREAERRRHNGIAIVLPTAFETPGSDWHDNYPK